MTEKSILSEKPEKQIDAALWGKETYERLIKSDEETKILKEKFTELFLENIKKSRTS